MSTTEPSPSAASSARETKAPSGRETRRAAVALRRLARDLRWTWDELLRRPFMAIDPEAWASARGNALAVLARVDERMLRARLADPGFAGILAAADERRRAMRSDETWFRGAHPESGDLLVAYFCSEFALHESMPQYAGGLGVLAGDHLKSTADLGVPVVGVGLLYDSGYYRQEFRDDGSTRVLYPRIDRSRFPLRPTGVEFDCPIGRDEVRVRVWRLRLGRTRVFLLDAAHPSNRARDRALTRGLYRGDPAMRIRQQVLLGIGGAMALERLRLPVTVYHLNEGHAAFATIERAAQLVRQGRALDEALVRVRQSCVFTTHTPVPAGHDRYDADDVVRLLRRPLKESGLSEEILLSLGRERPGRKEPFCMTALALRLAEHSNAVAALHGRVTREMWRHLYDRGDPAQVPIGHVTNGVHLSTWVDPIAREFWKEEVGIDLDRPNLERDPWVDAGRVDPARLWSLRGLWRRRLVRAVREQLMHQAMRRGADATAVAHAGEWLRDDALTIGFARRFASYKRAPLLFTDPDRLARLLADPARPVQIIFAGKAHPRDLEGLAFARQVHATTHDPRFRGRIVVLEEYDMGLAKLLVSGCDVWLNTPRRPHEASGTSGMKVAAHGGINLSILDGWWPEGFDGRNGWAIGDGHEARGDPDSAHRQDDAEATSLYELLEREVIPEFFTRSIGGVPERWMDRALRSAATIPGRFNTHRMVAEYLGKAYLPAHAATAAEARASIG